MSSAMPARLAHHPGVQFRVFANLCESDRQLCSLLDPVR